MTNALFFCFFENTSGGWCIAALFLFIFLEFCLKCVYCIKEKGWCNQKSHFSAYLFFISYNFPIQIHHNNSRILNSFQILLFKSSGENSCIFFFILHYEFFFQPSNLLFWFSLTALHQPCVLQKPIGVFSADSRQTKIALALVCSPLTPEKVEGILNRKLMLLLHCVCWMCI